jgi:hypothetical protein
MGGELGFVAEISEDLIGIGLRGGRSRRIEVHLFYFRGEHL